jgi:hypothetical protein
VWTRDVAVVGHPAVAITSVVVVVVVISWGRVDLVLAVAASSVGSSGCTSAEA